MKSKTPQEQPNNPLHGITLEMILNHLVDQLFQKQSQYEIEPEVSQKDALGKGKGGISLSLADQAGIGSYIKGSNSTE